MFKKEKTKDICPECKKRRKDGFSFCTCGNKLWDGKFVFKSFNDTGNSHQGVH